MCTECEDQCEDSESRTVHRSSSTPYSPSFDGAYDSLSKYQSDLIARNGNDVYHYPSPLHAVAVQNPIFFQSMASNFKEDIGPSKSGEVFGEVQKTEQHLVSENIAWPAQAPLNKRLDSYIYGLLQRRAQPMRTNKPRTSINTDPSKSVLRQASLCMRPSTAGQSQQWTSELASNWQTGVLTASAQNTDTSTVSPQRVWATETKGESLEIEARCSPNQPPNGCIIQNETDTNGSLKKKSSGTNKGQTLPVFTNDFGSANVVSSPKLIKHSYYPTVQDSKSSQVVKGSTSKKSSKIQHSLVCSARQEQSAAELLSLGSSSQSHDEEGLMVSAQYLPNEKQSFKLCKGGNKNAKNVKVKNGYGVKHRTHSTELVSEASRDRHRTASRRSRPVDDMVHSYKPSKRTSCKSKRIPVSIPEGRILEKHTSSTGRSSTHRHHGHHRHHDAVLAKPRYKRSDYHRKLRGIPEVPCEEAFRRVHRRHKREVYVPSSAHMTSPYAYVGSDSEYSAECASLFHSTIVDTSEDERSNYTTNRFGDSESSASEAEFVAESSSSSDSESSSSVNWLQCRQTSRDGAQAKAFVKIKASHNLKKKILRFRSGSLKLMTTV